MSSDIEQQLISTDEAERLDKAAKAAFTVLAHRAPDVAACILQGRGVAYFNITFPTGEMVCKFRAAGEKTFDEVFRVEVTPQASSAN